MPRTPSNEKLVLAFQDWLAQEGRSTLTIRAYTTELERLAAWSGSQPLARLRTEELREYLEEGAGATPATYNVRLAAIRKFYSWLVREALSEANIASELHAQRADRPAVQYLAREMVRKVLEGMQGNLRDTAMFLLLLSTGLKLMELVRLDREHFEAEGDAAQVEVESPAGDARTVYPSHQAADAVVSYLDSRRDEAIPLFISRAQARLAPRTIQASFAVHFRRAGVEGSVQTLRYTFGVHRSQSGVESHELQELMGYRALRLDQGISHDGPNPTA